MCHSNSSDSSSIVITFKNFCAEAVCKHFIYRFRNIFYHFQHHSDARMECRRGRARGSAHQCACLCSHHFQKNRHHPGVVANLATVLHFCFSCPHSRLGKSDVASWVQMCCLSRITPLIFHNPALHLVLTYGTQLFLPAFRYGFY